MYFAYYNVSLGDIMIVLLVGLFVVVTTVALTIIGSGSHPAHPRARKIMKYVALTIGTAMLLWGLAWVALMIIGLSQI